MSSVDFVTQLEAGEDLHSFESDMNQRQCRELTRGGLFKNIDPRQPSPTLRNLTFWPKSIF